MARRQLVLLSAAGACAVLAAALYVAVVQIPALQRIDLRILAGFIGLRGPTTQPLASGLAHLFDPAPYVVMVAAVVGIGLVRRRPELAVAGATAMIAASLTTQLLKPTLATWRGWVPGAAVGPASWPSGHTTAVMSFALALVLVSAPRWRPLAAAVGGLVTIGVVYSILLLGWHYPSDVLGGFLVAAGWTCLVAAAAQRPESAALRAGALVRPVGAALGTLAGLGALVVLLRPAAVADYAEAHTTFVVGALAIAAAAVAIAAAVSLVLSGSGRAPTAARRRPHPG